MPEPNSQINDTLAKRALITPLFASRVRPQDAITHYYALEHDARRAKIALRQNTQGRVLAFAAVCQTGIDLFRPMVVMHADDTAALHDAIGEIIMPHRPYLFAITPSLRFDFESVAQLTEVSDNQIYTLAREDFEPVVNVMVQMNAAPDGKPRAVIKARDGSTAAEAGASWVSSQYAELYVSVHPSVQQRGLGKSVVSAVANRLLDLNRTPIYVAATDNIASQRLAERVRFRSSGGRELSGAFTLR